MPTEDDDLLEVEDDAPAAPETDDDESAPPPDGDEEEEAAPPRPRRRERTEQRFANLRRALGDKDRELESLRTQINQSQQQSLERDIDGLKGKAADLKRKLKDAREAGDTDAEIEIEEELAGIRLRLSSVDIIRHADQQRQQPPPQQQTQAPVAGDAVPLTADEVRRAETRTNAWIEDSEFRSWSPAEQQVAVSIETVIAGKVKRGSDAYYRQIAARLKAAIPDRNEEIDFATRRQVKAKPRPAYDDDDQDDEPAPARPSPAVRRASVAGAADDGGDDAATPVRLSRAVLLPEMYRLLTPGGVLFIWDIAARDPAPVVAGLGYRPHPMDRVYDEAVAAGFRLDRWVLPTSTDTRQFVTLLGRNAYLEMFADVVPVAWRFIR